jgi:hypothetical protein
MCIYIIILLESMVTIIEHFFLDNMNNQPMKMIIMVVSNTDMPLVLPASAPCLVIVPHNEVNRAVHPTRDAV